MCPKGDGEPTKNVEALRRGKFGIFVSVLWG